MKNKIFSILSLVMLLIPVTVFAGNENDDVTYTATYEKGYTYGNVTECVAGGIAYQKGIKNVSGKKVCVWTIEHNIDNFQCDDKNMDKFQISITGSDKNTYVGYGCRKANSDEVIEYQKKELYVGYGAQVGDWTSDTCSIIAGDSIAFKEQNCYIEAVKEGETKIRVVNNKTRIATYYNYKVLKGYQSVSELDSNYKYGSVDDCSIGYGGKVTFDGLTFCGSKLAGYNYEVISLSCKSGYESFKLVFDSGGNHYKGYGCRKANSDEVIEYQEKELYVGYGAQAGSWTGDTCSIIAGDSIAFKGQNCYIEAVKEGETKIKVVNNNTNIATYYNYKVLKGYQSVSELDSNYKYGSVDDCSIGYGGKVTFDGLTFCGSKLAGYNYEVISLSCKSGYESFKLVFDSGGNHYKGYGCRKALAGDGGEGSEPNLGTEVTGCEVVPDEVRKWIKIILNFVKYIALILVVVLGTLDFIKAAGSGEADSMKKAGQSFLKRVIAVIILFLLPMIVELILNLINLYGSTGDCFGVLK